MNSSQFSESNLIAIVLAGGQGTRLRPLTDEQSKPALPFTQGLRLIDFVLSNLFNSGIKTIYVVAQYKPQSLVDHIEKYWRTRLAGVGGVIQVLLPKGNGAPGYLGTADAVYQNLDIVQRHRADLVAVFAADHVYRMDVRQMVQAHRTVHADVSIAAIPVPIAQASSFGVIATDADGRIIDFEEKPANPTPIPAAPLQVYASMGNYLFERELLCELLAANAQRGGNDFGHHVMPALPNRCRTYAYDFSGNKVPGLGTGEGTAYWRDVGSLGSYQEALREFAGSKPVFDIGCASWPIHGSHSSAPVEAWSNLEVGLHA